MSEREASVQTAAVLLPGEVRLPLVGFGTWQLHGRQAYDAVRYALDVGYRHVDTATMYGNEEQVGRAVRDSGLPREEIVITTKLQPSDAGREQQVLAASLAALGVEYLDLWLIHSPPWRHAGTATWQAFLDAQQRQLVRAVGVSNYDVEQLDEITDATGQAPAVNQVPWSPREHDPAVLAAHRQRQVVLEGYSPLKRTQLDHPTLVEIAQRHGVSPAQVVLRWHVEHGIPVIPKSGTRERIARNADVFSFSLDADEVAMIESRSRRP